MLKLHRIPKSQTLTPKQQNNIFKVGEKVYIRPDGKLYTNSWNQQMSNMIGEEYIIDEVKNVIHTGYGASVYNSDVKLSDLIIYICNEHNSRYFFHYKSVYSTLQIVPDYRPRKYR